VSGLERKCRALIANWRAYTPKEVHIDNLADELEAILPPLKPRKKRKR